MNDKEFLLVALDESRLRELAVCWSVPIADGRLRGPGIAKLISRKRSLSVADVARKLTDGEALAAVQRLEVPLEAEGARATLTRHLTGSSWRGVRTAHANFELKPDTLRGEVVEVIDGDTLRIQLDGKVETVRLRGVDAPESVRSDKVERDLDRAGHDDKTEFALGSKATGWLRRRLEPGTAVVLQVERRADRSVVKLHGHRLLAFVGFADDQDSDIGLVLIESGHALVWPRNRKSRRYHHPRVDSYLRACNAAFQSRPGLWRAGLERHCPAVQVKARDCTLADCERTCSPVGPAAEGSAP